MASPQLQMAKDAYKAVMDWGAKTPQELRVVFEKFAAASPLSPDINSEKVNAGGIEAEWISAPNAAADRAVLYVHGGGYVIGSINTHRDLMGGSRALRKPVSSALIIASRRSIHSPRS
jgi:monoterpene epsilon-lactone hydrolase